MTKVCVSGCLAVLLLCAAANRTDAAVTSALLVSSPGEPVGGGQFFYYGPDAGSPFPGTQYTNDRTEINLLLYGVPLREWRLDFAAPPGEPLAVGSYDNTVVPYDRQPGQPGLDIRSDDFCDAPQGKFEVKQIAFDADGRLQAFWATFEQSCQGALLTGEVRLDADPPLRLDAPSRRVAQSGRSLTFLVDGHEAGSGTPLSLTATGLPPGATFTDAGDGTGRFEWTPEVSAPGEYWVGFSAGFQGTADTIYTRVAAFPDFDDFDHPIEIPALPYFLKLDSPVLSAAADDPTCAQDMQGTAWFSFTPAADANIQVYLQADAPGGVVGLYEGDRGALQSIACGDDFVRADVHSGQTYRVLVGTREPGLSFYLRLDALPPPPPNDDLANATSVTTLPFSQTFDIGGARPDRSGPGACGFGVQVPDVWYTYAPTLDTQIHVDAFTLGISLFEGARDHPVSVGCDQSAMDFTALAGHLYDVMLWGPIIPLSYEVSLNITGRPVFRLGASVSPSATFDRRTGTVSLSGNATCTRPAHLKVRGTLTQDRVRGVQGPVGAFEADIACDGTAPWRAEVKADTAGRHPAHFARGPAAVHLEISGEPDDRLDPPQTLQSDDRITLLPAPR